MTPPLPPRIYQLVRAASRRAPHVRSAVAMLIALAAAITALGVLRVHHRHEVVSMGYELSAATEHVHALREEHRRLDLQLSTLADPQRIRALASALGMVTVAPDAIRVITPATPTPVPEGSR